MLYKEQLGLFEMAETRATVRSKPGSYFTGTLFKGDYFLAEHVYVHKTNHWLWGYGGNIRNNYGNFGWVRWGKFKRPTVATIANTIEQKKTADTFGQKILYYLKRHHRNVDKRYFASSEGPGLPPDNSSTATGTVHLAESTPFYLNRVSNSGRDSGLVKSVPAMLHPKDTVKWRYLTKDKSMHCVVFRPPGLSTVALPNHKHSPAFGHGKWGFIKNDTKIGSIEMNDGSGLIWTYDGHVWSNNKPKP